MNYHSIGYFAIFLPAVILIYQLCQEKYRWLVLLTANLVFFWLWSGIGVVYILAAILITWFFSQKLNSMQKAPEGVSRKEFQKKKKRILHIGVVCVLLMLAVLKYTNFVGSTIMGGNWTTIHILVPIGISYYTLQAISYMCDIADKKTAPAPSIGKLAVYLSFFPTLAQGPIAKYSDIGEQIAAGKPVTYENLSQGYQRILWGLYKKVVIADHIAPAMISLYNTYNSFGSMTIFAMILCTIQLYMDFSGTIDIAIGTGKIFGVTITENFRQPFFAKNAGDFWRRWHITLGVFLRTYVFYPVSLSKPVSKITKFAQKHFGKKAARYIGPMISLLCVWLCSGLWHGPKWTYVMYGLYYFVLIFVEQLLEGFVKKHFNEDAIGFRVFRFIKLCIIVGVGELFFMAPNFNTAMQMFQSIFVNFSPSTFINEWSMLGPGLSDYLIIFGGFSVVVLVSILKEKGISVRRKLENLPLAVRWAFWYCAIMVVLFFGAYGPGFSALDMLYAGF